MSPDICHAPMTDNKDILTIYGQLLIIDIIIGVFPKPVDATNLERLALPIYIIVMDENS